VPEPVFVDVADEEELAVRRRVFVRLELGELALGLVGAELGDTLF
jgi:hypothetical protein